MATEQPRTAQCAADQHSRFSQVSPTSNLESGHAGVSHTARGSAGTPHDAQPSHVHARRSERKPTHERRHGDHHSRHQQRAAQQIDKERVRRHRRQVVGRNLACGGIGSWGGLFSVDLTRPRSSPASPASFFGVQPGRCLSRHDQGRSCGGVLHRHHAALTARRCDTVRASGFTAGKGVQP